MKNLSHQQATSPSLADILDNEWSCVYCLAPTRPEDERCPACDQPLLIRQRVQEERTLWIWRGIFLQFVTIFYLVAFGSTLFIFTIRWVGVTDPMAFIPIYFGLPVDRPEALSQIVWAAFPWYAFWGGLLAIIYSLALLVMLYIRPPYGNIVYLSSGGVILLGSLLGLALFSKTYTGFIISLIGAFLGLGQLYITLNLWDDFTFREGRLYLIPDLTAKTHTSFFLSGRKYGKLKMWGLAALHLRRAIIGNMTNPGYHLALAVVYGNLKRYDLAEKTLQEAEKYGCDPLAASRLRAQLAAAIAAANESPADG
jgi:hypothetical protein